MLDELQRSVSSNQLASYGVEDRSSGRGEVSHQQHHAQTGITRSASSAGTSGAGASRRLYAEETFSSSNSGRSQKDSVDESAGVTPSSLRAQQQQQQQASKRSASASSREQHQSRGEHQHSYERTESEVIYFFF